MKTKFKAAVLGDFQVPYHDVAAIDVATQIVRDAKVDVLFINGDFLDLQNLSKFPSMRTNTNTKYLYDLMGEVAVGTEIYKQFVDECAPKRVMHNDGNHEYRAFRALSTSNIRPIGEYLEALVHNPLSTPNLLKFSELSVPVSYREYPHGQWLHPDLPLNDNIWIEHGNTVRAKTGYTISALQERRQASVLVNHVHRLSLGWKHVLGNRDFMMIENGHLSILGTPGVGDGMYQGAHHTVADYANSQQGFTMFTHVNGSWHPELIAIKNGFALYNGKSYKSRIINGKQKRLKA